MAMFNKLIFICLYLLLTACSTLEKVQLGAMEKVSAVKNDALVKVGAKTKHDLLIERLEETVVIQEETKQYVQLAYDELSAMSESVTDIDSRLGALNETYAQSEAVAKKLKKQIKTVDRLAKTLFIEWHRELRQYKNKNLRDKSAENLAATQKRYKALHTSMQKTYQSVEPLLSLLHDNQLYLKHNRSEVAMESFQQEVQTAGNNLDHIIEDIENSIQESAAFAEVITIH